MLQLTPDEFKKVVELNPAWASTLTEPVEIIGFCDMSHSPITHLSPMLHFSRSRDLGFSAWFQGCKHLKVAEGHFAGPVDFQRSGIEKIGDLTIEGPDRGGDAADFTQCENLKVAEGNFPGTVSFEGSGVERIGNLVITPVKGNTPSVQFTDCKKLRHVPSQFLRNPIYEFDQKTRARCQAQQAIATQPPLEI